MKNQTKNSLDRIVDIMDYIEEHDEQRSQKQIEQEFDKATFRLFSRYCLGDRAPYAEANRVESRNVKVFKLNQTGVRRLHELRGIVAEEKREKTQENINKVIAMTAALLVSLTALNVLISVGIVNLLGASFFILILIVALLFGFGLGLAFSIFLSLISKGK